MKLMTKSIEKTLPTLYATEEIATEDKVVQVKYFYGGWTWYGVEYDPSEGLFFGLVDGHDKEWGYFTLREFEELNASKGYQIIERDLYFTPKTIKELGI